MATRSDLLPFSPLARASFVRTARQLTVHLTGELDASSTPAIARSIADHVDSGDQRLDLDLDGLTFCDSSGLLLFFRLNEQATEAGTLFALHRPMPPVQRVLAISNASRVLRILP